MLTDDNPDIEIIVRHLLVGSNIVFSYSPDKKTSYIVYLSSKWTRLNNLHYGGNPAGHFFCGIVYKGFFHFELTKGHSFAPEYLCEKLNLPLADAKHMALLFNQINEALHDRPVDNAHKH